MTLQLKKWQHCTLSVALLAASLLLLYVILIMPALTGRRDFQERLEQLQFQYGKLSESSAQIEPVTTELKKLKNVKTDTSGFLEDKPEALAAADLQKHIKTLIETNGGTLVSTQVVRQKETETKLFPQVAIKVHMRVDMASLQVILYQLASEPTVLLLNDFFIQKRNQRTRRINQRIPELEVRFEIAGFIYRAET